MRHGSVGLMTSFVAWTLMSVATAQIKIDQFLMDNMVLQREAAMELSGTTAPMKDVTLRIAGQQRSTTSDANGNWVVELPALAAGGPYTLEFSTSGTNQVSYANVYIGDVYLCSGQSNMEFPVERSMPIPLSMAREPVAPVRFLTISKSSPAKPASSFPEETKWVLPTADEVAQFSAVCWFAALELQKKTQIPIGLIDASWGGSQIEAWLPSSKLAPLEMYQDQVGLVDLYATDPISAMRQFGTLWEAWWKDAYDNTTPWDGQDNDGWTAVPEGQIGDWKSYDDPEAAYHYGRVWYKKTVQLPENVTQHKALLSIGLVDDMDAVWVNGTFVGTTHSWSEYRRYAIPEGVLKPGANTIIVNVLNTYGPGGMMGPADEMKLSLDMGGDYSLASGWEYSLVKETKPDAPTIPWSSVSGFTTLFNGMIAPLGHRPLAGAIWYQGESNTGRADVYADLLQLLTKDWRQRFGSELPIVIIQLPNFGALPFSPVESGWSVLREGQRQVAKNDPKTGLTVTIDVGDRTDIHPPNKPIVALRTAGIMQMLQGKATGFSDGVAPINATRKRRSVTLTMPTETFNFVGGPQPTAFEVCGDKSGCRWAEATVDGNLIKLKSPDRKDITHIRYCWGDAPVCPLYTEENIPVVPFEMEIK